MMTGRSTSFPAHPVGSRVACAVCGETLPEFLRMTGANEPVCAAASCRMVMAHRTRLGEHAFKHYLEIHARQARQHRARVHAEAARRQQQAEDEAREEARYWQTLDDAAYPPEQFARVVVPAGPRHDRKLSRQRRRRYAEHVQRIIAAALASPADAAAAQTDSPRADASAPDAMAARLCGMCGGGCCTRGGDTAYLSADTIRRVLAQQPAWSAASLLAAYLGAVGSKARGDSCIHHRDDGCGLPRELRSDSCNQFACAALAQLQRRNRELPRLRGLVVIQRRQDQWQRTTAGLDNSIVGRAVLTPDRVEPWPRGASPADPADG